MRSFGSKRTKRTDGPDGPDAECRNLPFTKLTNFLQFVPKHSNSFGSLRAVERAEGVSREMNKLKLDLNNLNVAAVTESSFVAVAIASDTNEHRIGRTNERIVE